MAQHRAQGTGTFERVASFGDRFRRSFTSFLAVPSLVIAMFALLAVATYTLDRANPQLLRPFRDVMQAHVFGDPEATGALLGVVAGGVITITSITFSLLLLALQQSAGALTHDVLDQFLRRRANQAYFGFFVGMTLYALFTLATVSSPFNPVLGATVALLLTVTSLYVLLLLIYSTIDQMRPTEIVRAIHDHALRARQRQTDLLGRTRRTSGSGKHHVTPVLAPYNGFMVAIDLDALEAGIKQASLDVEVVYHVSIGAFLAFEDQYAQVRADSKDDAEQIATCIEQATHIEDERNPDTDPADGIKQLEAIAWRSISTSQHNPAPGIATIDYLRDILARWAKPEPETAEVNVLPVVYLDDVIDTLLGAFESLFVVASEAMQHQICASLLRSLAAVFNRLNTSDQRHVEGILLRSLAGLGDHVLTNELDKALAKVEETLESAGRFEVALSIRAAHAELAASIGTLNARSTRVPQRAGT